MSLVSIGHVCSHLHRRPGKDGGRQHMPAAPPSTHTHTPLTETETAEYN